MKHAFIAPTKYLNLVENDFHLVLAHLLRDDKKYREFYRKKKEQGHFIIMDNGAFELGKSLPAKALFAIIDTWGVVPDVIVAPDFPGEKASMTLKSTERFISQIERKYESTAIMGVPQSKEGNHKQWFDAYKEMCDMTEWVGMSILGIPNAFCKLTQTKDIAFNRMFCVMTHKEIFLKNADWVNHHFLGCGSPRELVFLKESEVAYSNDSSTAIWHGHLGIGFDNSDRGLIKGKTPIEVDFKANVKKSNIPTIKSNIRWINNLIADN